MMHTKERQNCPFQLSKIPTFSQIEERIKNSPKNIQQKLELLQKSKGSRKIKEDTISNVIIKNLKVKEWDTIIMGSDG